jgi:hypothetical protein
MMLSSPVRPAHWLLTICIGCAFSADALAQIRLPFQRPAPAATANSGLQELTEVSGPWLIMCASFAGEDGLHQARQLASELSSHYNLAAYVYRHEFNIEQELARKGFRQPTAPAGADGLGKRKLASEAQFDEVAVLLGDFPSIDDGYAQKILSTVKAYQPQFEVSANDEVADSAGDRIKAFREGMAKEDAASAQTIGPLRLAFLMPNPLLPDTYFSENKLDEFVVKMNKRTKYSLLKNSGKYTVKVAEFNGGTKVLNDSVSDKLREMKGGSLFRKSKKASDLETALLKANVLTKYLRKHEKLEAYEFHDRNASYVCVGSFDWATRQSGLGTETNPELKAVLEKFTGSVESVTMRQARAKSFPLPKKLTNVGISCMVQPELMPVPKAPSGSVASRLMNKIR